MCLLIGTVSHVSDVAHKPLVHKLLLLVNKACILKCIHNKKKNFEISKLNIFASLTIFVALFNMLYLNRYPLPRIYFTTKSVCFYSYIFGLEMIILSMFCFDTYYHDNNSLIFSKGTLQWVKSLEIFSEYSQSEREPFACSLNSNTCGFVKSYKNFSFFWIMNAGHMVGLELQVSIISFNSDYVQIK